MLAARPRSEEARGRRAAEVRSGGERSRRRLHRRGRCMLGHHRLRRSALLEHHHDAIASAAGREHVDGIRTGTQAEEDADGVHAPRLEQIGSIGADAHPQAAPFGHGVRHDLLGLTDDCRRAAPLAELDGLRRGASREANDRGGSKQERLQLGQHAGSSFRTWADEAEPESTIIVWLKCGGRQSLQWAGYLISSGVMPKSHSAARALYAAPVTMLHCTNGGHSTAACWARLAERAKADYQGAAWRHSWPIFG